MSPGGFPLPPATGVPGQDDNSANAIEDNTRAGNAIGRALDNACRWGVTVVRARGFPYWSKGFPYWSKGFPYWSKGFPYWSKGFPYWSKGFPYWSKGFPYWSKGFPYRSKGFPYWSKEILCYPAGSLADPGDSHARAWRFFIMEKKYPCTVQ